MIHASHRLGLLALLATLAACSFDRGGLTPTDGLRSDRPFVDLVTPDGPRDASLPDTADLTPGEAAGDLPVVPWFDSTWSYRKRITVSATMVAGSNHTDFPLLLTRDPDTELAAHADPEGDDLVFVLPGGTTKLDHELERFDNKSGTLVAWVKLPTLSGGADTVLHLYYGKSTSSQQAAKQVWSGGYEAVWHLGTDPAKNQPDATGHNHTGAPRGNPNLGVGKAGYAVSFDGVDDALDISGLDVTATGGGNNGLTLEAWVFSRTGAGRVISKASGTGISAHYWMLALAANASHPAAVDFRLTTASGSVWAEAQNTSELKKWIHLAATYDGSQMRIYKNGKKVHGEAHTGTIATSSGVKTSIGDNPVGDRFLDAILDEVRVSSLARDVDWLATQYNNQSAPSTYITFGAEEPRPQ